MSTAGEDESTHVDGDSAFVALAADFGSIVTEAIGVLDEASAASDARDDAGTGNWDRQSRVSRQLARG